MVAGSTLRFFSPRRTNRARLKCQTHTHVEIVVIEFMIAIIYFNFVVTNTDKSNRLRHRFDLKSHGEIGNFF